MTQEVRRVPEISPEIKRLRRWIDDLQSGMWISCVYCGHRYGPSGVHASTIPDGEQQPSMQEALRRHISECPEHPLATALSENATLRERLQDANYANDVRVSEGQAMRRALRAIADESDPFRCADHANEALEALESSDCSGRFAPHPPTAQELLHLDPAPAARRRWAWGQETYGDYDRDGFEDAYEEGLDMHAYLAAMARRRDRLSEAGTLLNQLYPILVRLREICRRERS